MKLLEFSAFVVGNTVLWLTIVASLFGWIRRRALCAGVAVGQGVSLVGYVAGGHHLAAGIAAAGAAFAAWMWWNEGGGDSTKRRLKRCARRFQGVRRTAPVGAS